MNEHATVDATGFVEGASREARAYLVVQVSGERTRLIDLPEGAEVTLGRSRTATLMVDSEKVSRLHAKIARRGDQVLVEDLGSRNGTRVNGERIAAPTRVNAGDEVGVGPATAVLAMSSPLGRARVVGSTSELDERLEAEVDRATRYRRPLALLMLRLEGSAEATETALGRVSANLRRMDGIAEYGPDELAVVLPEADRLAAEAAAVRLAGLARAVPGVRASVGLAVFPGDGVKAGELTSRARAALRRARTAGHDGIAAPPPEPIAAVGDVVVADPQMRRIHDMIARIAPTPITVLILGETGVGKEIVAEALHQRSGRAKGPFVKLNCASLPETLLESELFGHERGAFTGADRKKTGYVEAASGGTLFLDEIGDAPPSIQAKLLRVLETRRVTRVGGTAETEVDIRLVCATNRDLEEEIRRGRFREDLFFRVSGITLVVPPLRDRRGEIRVLAEHFAREFARELKTAPPAFSPDAITVLESYPWPGNVRELRNAIERAVVLHGGEGRIGREHLPERLREAAAVVPRSADQPLDVRERVAEVERDAIIAAMDACRGNQSQAALRLGISRRALIYKLEKYGLKAPPPSAR